MADLTPESSQDSSNTSETLMTTEDGQMDIKSPDIKIKSEIFNEALIGWYKFYGLYPSWIESPPPCPWFQDQQGPLSPFAAEFHWKFRHYKIPKLKTNVQLPDALPEVEYKYNVLNPPMYKLHSRRETCCRAYNLKMDDVYIEYFGWWARGKTDLANLSMMTPPSSTSVSPLWFCQRTFEFLMHEDEPNDETDVLTLFPEIHDTLDVELMNFDMV